MSDPVTTSADSYPAPRTAPSGRSVALTWSLAGAVAAVAVTAALVLTAGSSVYAVLGYPDPGAVTKLGVNVLRLGFDVAGAACLGSLVFCAFFTTSRQSGLVSADGYAALRFGGGCAWVWFVVSLLMTVFDTADSTGQPVGRVLSPQAFLGLLDAVDAPKAWLLSALAALVVALSCHFALRWRTSMALAGVAGLGLLPPVFVSHSASNAGHDFATNSLVFHVVAASLWLGVLIAVVLHARRGGARADLVAVRYGRLALGCWIVLAVSGVIDALVLVPPAELPGTGYGTLVLLKVACLLVLGAASVFARRRTARRVRAGDAHSGLLRLAGVEIAIMLVTLGVSMGMAQTPPPNLLDPDSTASELLIGYNLPDPPSLLGFVTMWRLDLLVGTAAIVLAAVYLLGLRRLRGRGEAWPAGRTVAWLGGCATILVATSSGLGMYAPAMFSVHMVAHLMLNLLAPVLLVLGGPVTLALQALLPAGRGELSGPREWLLGIVRSSPVRLFTHPGIAALLLVCSLYALYLTGLFEAVMQEHWAHQVMDVYFLVTGYLFFWTVLGTDHSPRQLPQLARLGITLGIMPLLAFFGVIVLSMPDAIAGNYYRTLTLPWTDDLMGDQQLGALIGWLGGEVPLLLVLLVLLWQWNRAEQRGGSGDRTSAEDADYEEMLTRLAESRRS